MGDNQMSHETLIVEKDSGVVHIVLNRPDRLNALNMQMQNELWEVVEASDEDDDVHIIVFSGAPRPDGRGNFSAGVDVKEKADTVDPATTREGLAEHVRSIMMPELVFRPPLLALCSRLETMRTPSIAAIDGICTAGGLELALACDIRFAAETARISDLHIKNLGHIGGGGISVRLARTVGPAWAKQIMFAGAPIDPHTARRIGLVNEVFPAEELVPSVLERAREMAERRPDALAMAKGVMYATADMPLEAAVRYSVIGRAALLNRTD